jgi:UDP-N-acetylmuramate--alanine ligase
VTGRLAVPGAHNAVNAAGAVAVLLTLGYALEPALRAVEGSAARCAASSSTASSAA